jgi:hypothetical protein
MIMAETDEKNKVISKTNEGFPEWLDFDKLRQEGIDYLGKLAGNIWTDHNVHDPGITILEMLCYALLDLGYRTSLPPKDLFAKDPADLSEENNFFTPAQILGCNPLTITDYRKLLVDLPGIKNAWLEVAEDITVNRICDRRHNDKYYKELWSSLISQGKCISFLNGLYHVYLDLEDEPDEKHKKKIIATVKKALMSHRNLCEDFYDIIILCKQKIGVCADIELDSQADPDKVYLDLITKLRDFFSPSPKFYRLKQLLDKGRPIEDIFAGRPFDLKQSHGFVDMDDLENITLKKEFHLSDVYNVINDVEGITGIRNLRIKNCDKPDCDQPGFLPWIFKLHENHVADFDPYCSGFQFTRNGASVLIDPRKYHEALKLNFLNTGKTLMYPPSENLDLLLEQGDFRKELAEYYPMENEFPKVYGITEGSLPDDVSNKRKAQSLQLKAYLLFFDHLLAGYLSQLKNIRNLFAIRQTDSEQQHTYFINKLSDWPGLERLLHFSPDEASTHGNVIAIPVSKQALEYYIKEDSIDDCEMEKHLSPFLFSSAADRDVAVFQMLEDLTHGNFTDHILVNNTGCWSYYFFTSSDKFAIVGKSPYKNKIDAQKALASLRYSCADINSYRKYTTLNGSKFSFNISSSVSGYWSYLQLLTENQELYHERRNGFLDHLLSRFAEKFTDYALLSYSFLKENDLLKENIFNKERFLSSYPDLSSDRGKGYDYQLNGCHNNNVSGVEKKFEALAGLGLGHLENLCHFEVMQYEEQTVVNISWKGFDIFASEKTFESREEGREALHSLLMASADPTNYYTSYSSREDKYQININATGIVFTHPFKFETKEKAENAIIQIHRFFSPTPLQADISPSEFQHDVILEKKDKEYKWIRNESIVSREKDLPIKPEILENFNDKNLWKAENENNSRELIQLQINPDHPQELINLNAFEPYINRVDVKNQLTIFKYTVSDPEKSFFFVSEQEFEQEPITNENLLKFLFILKDYSNYYVRKAKENEWLVQITVNNQLLATNTIEYPTEEEAKISISIIVNYVNAQIYFLKINSKPIRWRSEYKLGLPATRELVFEGKKDYDSEDKALQELEDISSNKKNFDVVTNKGELELKDEKHPRIIIATHKLEANEEDAQKTINIAKDLLSLRKLLNKLHTEPAAPEFEAMVARDKISIQGDYGYQLVKKNDYQARYLLDGEYQEKTSRDQTIKPFYQLYHNDLEYLEICYGGHNIIERTDSVTGQTWYHYRIMTWGLPNSSLNEIVLFESVTAYSSAEEAQRNFDEQYVHILTAATDLTNYGTLISFEKMVIHKANYSGKIEAVVFIPEETMRMFGYNHDYASQKLSELSATYPVRIIREDDQLFADYFLCGKLPEKPDKWDCEEEKNKKYFYYFIFKNSRDKAGSWISYHYYKTAKETREAFHFFLILLHYKGNYHIDYNICNCKWTLYLREVLVVSKRRFPTAEAAWKHGVMNFICASQSKDAFSAYLKEDRCCYSFHVACGNTGLIHPCTYDTPEKRDKALQRLFKASQNLYESIKSNSETQPWDHLNMMLDSPERLSPCERTITGIETFLGKLHGLDVSLALYNANNMIGSDTATKFEGGEANVEELKKIAHYYPVVKKKLDVPGSKDIYRYFVEIKLPEFCHDDLSPLQPCGCNEKQNHINCCCTAWVSECCFETCEEAFEYYYKIIGCLAEIKNYYTVFDCECGPYGIRFYCDCNEEKRQPHENHDVAGLPVYNDANSNEKRSKLHCCNEILAFNPQCYTSSKMVCEAIERAKILINAEGLHLVEHILLRPHCVDEDCNCIIETCREGDPCDFEWTLSQDDPCVKDKKYCFVPGSDPYSFIATAILPAWPERFRKKGNRQLVEQMLYREMPAHVMLRILWVTPKDLCQFENIYYQWVRWSAGKNICVDYNPPCRLIDFLFHHEFDCFDCEECIPCESSSNAPDPCNFSKEQAEDPNRYLNEINNLYCWPLICPEAEAAIAHDTSSIRAMMDVIEEEKEEEEDDLKKIKMMDREDAERLIDQRFHKYRETAKEIFDLTRNENAANALSFINNPSPAFYAYKEVTENIIANKRSVEHLKMLTSDQKKMLISAMTWYFLDRIVLEDRIAENKSDLNELFKLLQKRELMPVYRNWKGTELTSVKPDAAIPEIHKMFKK